MFIKNVPCVQQWRDHQSAIIQFVEERIELSKTDDNVINNVNAVTENVINDVKRKFQSSSLMFGTFVHRVTEVVIKRHRQVVDADHTSF